jgi:hypothetical protein
MAINVSEVYNTVLLILNKEQRGYITPDEFNKIGNQVQLEIFEKYFEDLNQQLRVRQDETEYADRVKNIDDKISIFKTVNNCTWSSVYNAFTLPTDPAVHRIGSVMYQNGADLIEVERVQKNDLLYLNLAPLTKPSKSFPVYTYQDKNSSTTEPRIYVHPTSIGLGSNVSASYVRKPNNPRWGYTVGGLGQYLYDFYPYIATGLPIVSGYLFQSLTTNFTATTTSPIQTSFIGLTSSSAGVTYTGSGTGAIFNLTLGSDGVITDLTVTAAGSGYAFGDTFTFDRNVFQLGGSNIGTVDALFTISDASLYSGTSFGSTQFEIDSVDQTELVLNILKYCGIVIRDPQIIQSASQMAIAEDNNEKS